jgi:hypothetical protein
MEEGCVYWRLYEGNAVTPKAARKRGENRDEVSLEESCDKLMARLEQYGAGTYTVVLLATPNLNNAKGIHHTVSMGSAAMGNTASTGMNNSFMQMLEMMKFMDQRSNSNVEAIVSGAMEEARKDFEIMRLRDKLKEAERGGPKDRMIDGLVKTLPALLPKMLGVRPSVLGTAGFGAAAAEPPAEQVLDFTAAAENKPLEKSTPPAGAQEGESETAFSIDQATNACLTIQAQLDGMGIQENINDLLWKIAKFFDQQPEQAPTVISILNSTKENGDTSSQ